MCTSLSLDQQNLNLRVAIYHVLLHHQMDKADWKGALELLDTAVRDTPCSRQQLWAHLALSKSLVINKDLQNILAVYFLSFLFSSRLLQRHRILVKARLGESIITDVRKLQRGGETNCTSLWHQAALSSVNVTQQLEYYKSSINSPMVLYLFFIFNPNMIWSMSRHHIRKISLFSWGIFLWPCTRK